MLGLTNLLRLCNQKYVFIVFIISTNYLLRMKQLCQPKIALSIIAMIILAVAFVALSSYKCFQLRSTINLRVEILESKGIIFNRVVNLGVFAMLVISNIIYWCNKNAAYFLLTIIVAAIFTAAYFEFEEQIFIFKKANGLWEGGFSMTYMFGIVQILVFTLFVLINYWVIKQYRNKAQNITRNIELTPNS